MLVTTFCVLCLIKASSAQSESPKWGFLTGMTGGIVEPTYIDVRCWDIQCDGEGCIYETIGTTFESNNLTCNASYNCFFQELHEPHTGAVRYIAGCNGWCPPSLTQSTTMGLLELRRRRDVIMVTPNCCYTDFCNHNSPCGSLNCAQKSTTTRSNTTTTTTTRTTTTTKSNTTTTTTTRTTTTARTPVEDSPVTASDATRCFSFIFVVYIWSFMVM